MAVGVHHAEQRGGSTQDEEENGPEEPTTAALLRIPTGPLPYCIKTCKIYEKRISFGSPASSLFCC